MAFDIKALQNAANFSNASDPNNLNISRYILTHANANWNNFAGVKGIGTAGNPKSPSVLSRILDIMSRPSYAVDEMAHRIIQHVETQKDPNTGEQVPTNPQRYNEGFLQSIGDILHGGASGLAGTQKTSWSKIFNEINPKASPVAKYGGGFLLDVLTDPTTYLGPGIARNAIRGTRALIGTTEAAQKGLPEAKGAISVIRGIAKEPVPTGESQALPEALNRASSQVKLPEFSAPGAVHAPTNFPKVSIDTSKFGLPTKTLEKTATLPKIAKDQTDHIVEPAFNNDFRRTAELLAQHYGEQGKNIDVEALTNKLASTPKRFIRPYIRSGEFPTKGASELDQLSPLSPAQVDKIAGGSARKTAQILGQIAREKGHNIDVPALEKTLAKTPKHLYGEYVSQVRELPVKSANLQSKFEKEAANAQRLGNLAKSKASMIGEMGAPNVVRAGDIIDRIAQGDYELAPKIAPKGHVMSPANAEEQRAAIDEATKFEHGVLSKSNNFPKVVGKIPSVNNPAQQANLFLRYATKIAPQFIKGATNPNAKRFMAKRYVTAYRMMKAAEKYYADRGLHPTFWDGTKVSLTDVIDELGGPLNVSNEHMTQLITAFKNKNPAKIVSPEIRQAIENVRARSALQDAKWVKQSLDTNTQQAAVAQQVLSDGKYNDFVKKLVNANKTVMNMATDASPSGISAAQKLMTDILQRNGTLPQLATNAKKSYIQLYVTPESKKIKWLPVQEAQTRAIEQTLGTNPAKLGKSLDYGNNATNWFLSRFATWYGQKDLRPDVLNQTATAMNNAASRAAIWNDVAKKFTPDEINEAFKVAQGHVKNPSSQRVAGLGAQIEKAMENLFSSTGITNEAQKAASVVMRSGALIQDLNEQLKLVKSGFKFQQGKEVKDFMGGTHDFSKGVDWLKSWQTYEAKDPLDLIMRVETATEQLMHKYAFLDETAARYGSKIKSSVFSTPVAMAGKTHITPEITIGRLDGVYFPKELAPQIDRAISTWHQIYDPKSPLIKFVDRVTRAWKSGVTIYAPQHHIRNFIGDTYLSWLAGVNNPRSYSIAGRVMHSQRSRYDALETINNLTDKNALRNSLTRPGDKVLTTKSGIDLTAEQIYLGAHSNGLLAKVSILEDLVGDPLIKAQPFNGKIKHFVQNASELREHYVRIAHFVDILRKSNEKNLPRLFSEAAKEVRKWHPDGMDMTKTEKEVLKRLIPFYSWTRKAIPLLVEGAVQKPGKILAYPRAMYAIQGMNGIQSPSVSDPFPQDQLFPNWIKAKGIGPVMGTSGHYDIVNPSNPFNDVVSQYLGVGRPQDIASGIGSSVNPLLRIPAELATGNTTLQTPVYTDPNKYITEQIPLVSMLSRLGNVGIMGTTKKGQKNGVGNWPNILNYLTALGYQPTAPYITEAKYEQKGKQ